MEAKNLISYMDDNRDGMLSMEEIMKHKDIFISSKVMNFAANVHDEFWLLNGRIVKKWRDCMWYVLRRTNARFIFMCLMAQMWFLEEGKNLNCNFIFRIQINKF